jgi:hypothetical protein
MATNKNQKKAPPTSRPTASRRPSRRRRRGSQLGLKAPSASEASFAQKEGIEDAIKESAKDAYKALTDGALPGASPGQAVHRHGRHHAVCGPCSTSIPEAFADRVEKGDRPVPEEKVAGLLSLERAGKNRTPYVKALMEASRRSTIPAKSPMRGRATRTTFTRSPNCSTGLFAPCSA